MFLHSLSLGCIYNICNRAVGFHLSFPRRWESHVVSKIVFILPPCIYRSAILPSSDSRLAKAPLYIFRSFPVSPHSLLLLPPNPNKVKVIFIGGNRSFIIFARLLVTSGTFVSQFSKVPSAVEGSTPFYIFAAGNVAANIANAWQELLNHSTPLICMQTL